VGDRELHQSARSRTVFSIRENVVTMPAAQCTAFPPQKGPR
jgi:hypothetical protein